MLPKEKIIDLDSPILVTGAGGFLGPRVASVLLEMGFRNIRCLIKPNKYSMRLEEIIKAHKGKGRASVISGNLLLRSDCLQHAKDVAVIYHLAAGTGTKAFSDAYLNSVIATRNLLDASLHNKFLLRFVNVSSFAVYTNRHKPKWRVLDESCPIEDHPESRAEAYLFGKVKQDELVVEYGDKHALPYVILRPGNIFGPGKYSIPGRVGIDSFGIYMDFGGSNPLPLSYVDNCAEAIVLAGLIPGVNRHVFNIVDDNLPSCREFLRLYKNNVKRFKSLYIPHPISYVFCYAWEIYSKWSKGQLPPIFSRREWAATWKKTNYDNSKIKDMLGWTPRVPLKEGLNRFFASIK